MAIETCVTQDKKKQFSENHKQHTYIKQLTDNFD